MQTQSNVPVLKQFIISHPNIQKWHTVSWRAVLAPHGLEYLGFGVESSVYKKQEDSEVIKVHRRSINMPPDQKQLVLEKKLHEFAMLKLHLGSFMLEQTITVDRHPLGDGLEAVQTRQPYYEFLQGLELFTMGHPNVNIVALDQLCRAHTGIDDALKEFVDASFSAAEGSSCLPDTNGVRNLVVGVKAGQGSELKLIDTQPITPESPYVQELVRKQLTALQIGLQEVA